MEALFVNQKLSIPSAEMRLSFDRSSGPGGQHVNKANTRVELRFDVQNSPTLTPDQRRRLLESLANRLNQEGVLSLHSERHRSQWRNRQDCLEKLATLLAEHLRPPPPKRRPTRPSRASQVRRKQKKSQQAQKKAMRRRPPLDS